MSPMLQSMTGYGTGAARQDERTVTVEIRTVNHRFLDLHIRTPRECSILEAEVQPIIRGALRRGRVDVSIGVQGEQEGGYKIDKDVAQSYVESASKLREQFHLEGALDLSTLLALPGVIQTKNSQSEGNESASSALCPLVCKAAQEALDNVLLMREREGKALRTDLLNHLARILALVSTIQTYAATVAQDCCRKMEERMARLLPQDGLDPQRLAQEVALLADKSDISEEIARLGSHLEQFHNLIEEGKEIGKRLDFLLQEMQREVNTILSKSGNLEISRCGIDIKAEIEKVREQVQNVE
jgi:uncharacterized protein (TIGR00255 family)